MEMKLSEKVKRVVCHIGFHKTGSTTIQDASFYENQVLIDHGVFYPKNIFPCYPRQHSELAQVLHQGKWSIVDSILSSICENARSTSCDTVFLSGEDLCILDASAVQGFAQACRKHFDLLTFACVVRNRRDWMMSSFKQHLRYAGPTTEIRFVRSQNFSPKKVLGIWTENFSKSNHIFSYDSMKNSLVRDFFSEVFDLRLKHEERKSNSSLDLMTLMVYNIFLKEKASVEIDRILWAVYLKHRSEMTFSAEDLIADDLIQAASTADWDLSSFGLPMSFEQSASTREAHHDPVLVCDKFIDLFILLRAHFVEQGKSKNEN